MNSKRVLSRVLAASAVLLFALGPMGLDGPSAEAKEGSKKGAKVAKKGSKKKGGRKGTFEYGCRVQSPQKFLERRSFVHKRILEGQKHAHAVRWLAEHYGHVDDELTRRLNPRRAFSQAKTIRFMGLPIVIHEKIAPALTCVEKRIQRTCTGRSSYKPRAVGGFREANTYRGTEISNHLFGIAVDIDPDKNPCCGCVEPWSSHPLCKKKTRTAYERTAMPKCWIKSFERFGFDWLGHDELEDTMHFEFLGDPDRIKK